MAEAMVLAVYIPPHAPAPGQALRTVSMRVASSDLPDTNSPGTAAHSSVSAACRCWKTAHHLPGPRLRHRPA
jgi:hypothetical protein